MGGLAPGRRRQTPARRSRQRAPSTVARRTPSPGPSRTPTTPVCRPATPGTSPRARRWTATNVRPSDDGAPGRLRGTVVAVCRVLGPGPRRQESAARAPARSAGPLGARARHPVATARASAARRGPSAAWARPRSPRRTTRASRSGHRAARSCPAGDRAGADRSAPHTAPGGAHDAGPRAASPPVDLPARQPQPPASAEGPVRRAASSRVGRSRSSTTAAPTTSRIAG